MRMGVIGIQFNSMDALGVPYQYNANSQEYLFAKTPTHVTLHFDAGKPLMLNQLNLLTTNKVHIIRVDAMSKSNANRKLKLSNKIVMLGNYWRCSKTPHSFHNANQTLDNAPSTGPLIKSPSNSSFQHIMNTLLSEQRIGRLPFVTQSQLLMAREKNVQIGADLLRGQYGIVHGEWIRSDPLLNQCSYLVLHRFQHVDVSFRIEKSSRNQAHMCKVLMELDASTFEADVYHLEASLHNRSTKHPLCQQQMFNLRRGIMNQLKIQFQLPENEKYTQIKDATFVLTNMQGLDHVSLETDYSRLNHPSSYAFFSPFIVSVYAERFALFSRKGALSGVS
eukprot:CAMPEP_0117444220 /NCGR_PEP_ID=MMETSP0759-20121206/5120_1 /TAXON_ID=63605 /ORGANISM="Percolomonas cosmopolitus, Strain WS" /LENGTH=334 /DNA_ID=CAMNT_0005236263 /DNA_START=293 /DNA_END=1297 /DNA_ORIENTATION=+